MRGWQAVTGGLGALALLTACGGDGGFAEESPDTIRTETVAAMKDLSTVTMTGDITSDGQQIGVDLQLSTEGDCAGTITLAGGGVEIIGLGGESWMRPDEAAWTALAGGAAAQIMELVGDKWVVVPSGEQDLTEVCDLSELVDNLDDDDNGDFEVVGTEDLDGTETVKVTTARDDGDITAWIRAEEPHHILQMEVASGDEPGTIEFSGFDEELDVVRPADEDVIDLSQVG